MGQLRVIRKQAGDEWKQVRMSELKITDRIILGDEASVYEVQRSPYIMENGVWAVVALKLEDVIIHE